MQYLFDSINKDSLTKLYSVFGFRSKEIGALVGVSEDAILKRLKQYEIPTNPRRKEKLNIDVLYTGKRKDKRNALSNEELLRLCKIGYTDAAIGGMFNMTGEGIAYRRKKIGISLNVKYNKIKNNTENLKNTSKEILEYDYYNLNQKEFSDKYGVSKIIWRPHLNNIGVIGKQRHRIESYPIFNKDQKSLIIGSLLGDGSVSGGVYFYEYHSNKQKIYLLKKFEILQPYSARITPSKDNSGFRFSTIHHPNFKEFHDKFYEKGLSGKLIPLDFIKENWSDDILAYWFLDDGYYDDVNNEIFVFNFCPKKEQLRQFLDFLNERFNWNFDYSFYSNIYNIKFSKKYYKEFIDIVLKVATPDMYYKIPEKYLTTGMVQKISFDEVFLIKPKFYRLSSEDDKKRMVILLFKIYRKHGFPYLKITLKRLNYLLDCFKNVVVKINDITIAHNNTGVKLCEALFPNIYECHQKNRKSPLELWEDDKSLQRLIINRLSYADRISDSSIRTGIKLMLNSVTNFKPIIAKFLYQKYAPNGRIFDYSCGFGSRMLAAMSLDMEYIGCEPNLKTYENLNKFGTFLLERTKGKFFITDKGSEEYVHKKNYFDFAFSSPPFFDYEIYSQDPGQSIIKHPFYDDWLKNFWKKVIDNCYSSIAPGGFFGVCISLNKHEHFIEKTKEFCFEIGLSFEAEFKAPYKQLFQKNVDKFDLILIYKK